MNEQKAASLREAFDRSVEMVTGLPGTVGLYLKDMETGLTASYRAEESVGAASVIKLFIMAEAFRQREEGLLSFDEEVTIRQEDKMPSCGALTYMHTGLRVTIRDLVVLMIIVSDNSATNLLIDRLGLENIQNEIDRLGASNCDIQRKLWQSELSRKGIHNHVSAAGVGLFMEKLLRGEVVSEESSKEMLSILLDQRLNGKMPFYLHSEGIRCAHKTGEDDGITHDCGIIYGPSPRIFCFVSEHTDVPEAERVLQEAARLVAHAQ